MMRTLSELSPQPLWNYFSEILQIPRPSKKEELMIAWLQEFAVRHHLPFKKDHAGNVLITKPPFPGKENLPVVVLQTHMDMVCEKNNDKIFDFEKDPVRAVVGSDWVSADGTTLGADDGIGIATQLALLEAGNIEHGPLECLFTIDEETGLTGANALKPGFFTGKILINLDSEDEGEIFIGCAGGIDTIAVFRYKKQPVTPGSAAILLKVTGLQGGHSGDDIHRGLGNANKILARFLYQIHKAMKTTLADFDGGNLRNAIPREARAVIVIPDSATKEFLAEFEKFSTEVRFEFEKTEPGLQLSAGPAPLPSEVISERSYSRLLIALMACPHGVLEWSTRMPGMVETSTNLASVRFTGNDRIVVTTSQRSEINSRKKMAADMVESVFRQAGADVSHSDGYPGWAPEPESAILKLTVESYRRLFNTDPVVRSIHAGLECGLFLEKYPGLDMVSIGPTIKGVHSPAERINIETVGKFWKHLVDILQSMES